MDPDTSARPPEPRSARIGPLLRHAQRRLAREYAEALRPLGIEGRHYGVLVTLGRYGPLSQRELLEHTGSEKSAMVRTVDDLEARGLAVRRRSPTDRRAHAVDLTGEGRALLARAPGLADEVADRLLACLDEEEQVLLFALLERFVAADAD